MNYKQRCEGHLKPERGGGGCNEDAAWRLDWRDQGERVAKTAYTCAQHLHQVAKAAAPTCRHGDVLISLLTLDQ